MTDQVISNIIGVPLRGAITFFKLEVQVGQFHRSYFYLYYLYGVQKLVALPTNYRVWATFVVGRRPEESRTECRTLSWV
jgi:hypothetical protein